MNNLEAADYEEEESIIKLADDLEKLNREVVRENTTKGLLEILIPKKYEQNNKA